MIPASAGQIFQPFKPSRPSSCFILQFFLLIGILHVHKHLFHVLFYDPRIRTAEFPTIRAIHIFILHSVSFSPLFESLKDFGFFAAACHDNFLAQIPSFWCSMILKASKLQ
jgi:hypothetical protein